MTPHPAYKSTNLPWLPKIPEHWECSRIKNLFSLRDERNYEDLSKVNLISVYTNLGVVQHCDIIETTGNRAVNADGYKRVYRGDIVVNIILCWMGAMGKSNFDGVTSPAYDVYRPKANISVDYYHFLFRTNAFCGECKRQGHGIMMMRWRTYSKDFLTIPIPLPPPNEQEQIVRYLDAMTVKINKLIRAKKKQIALLQEQRQAIINQAVTKGLDPNAEMKDSGIDWIGEIPKHWNVCKVKHLCSMQAGDNLTADVIQETGKYPVYGANGRRGFYHAYNLNNNCLLVGRQGALCGNVHIVSGKIWATDHAVVTVPTKRTHISYLYYLLLAMNLNQYALETAAQPGLSVSVIQNLPTLLVPLDEQQEIASFLDKQTAIIDAAIDKMKASIKALNEYKNSLISSVVTGQTDVRNIPVEDVVPDDLISEDDPTPEIEDEPTNESEE